LILENRVTVNGSVPQMRTKIGPEDLVRIDGKLVSTPRDKPVYIAFNKPVGIVCTTDIKVERNNIIDYIK